MRSKLLNIFHVIYNLKNKIAFFPTIMAIGGTLFAYIMMSLENHGISKYLLDFLPELVINNTESARAILTTFIGGLISIMVFSFSMVMILLNQASNNFSPRLLPGLISNRRHQIILGVYLSTIIYCIFILVFIEPTGEKYQLPGFSVLFSIVFMISSLGCFIYFIHSISQQIQIDNILLKIFSSAENKLEKLIEKEKEFDSSPLNTENWNTYKAKRDGYFSTISVESLVTIAKENTIKIEIVSNRGSYCHQDSVLFKVDKKIEEQVSDQIYNNFNFSKSELIDDSYLLSFKQITEVAVKSMSPGINDPGTAMNAIDYLSQLLILRVQKKDINLILEKNEVIITLNTLNFNELIYDLMAALRTYCAHDVLIVKKLLAVLKNLIRKATTESYKKTIKEEIRLLLIDAKREIANAEDFKKVEELSAFAIKI
ncbi:MULTISPECIES: DUF2254 domain-containing protein [unclassified Polaribacter]|uniref:DUF2254 domain-containing protein n=1 Tax=unclassified Polaribacter TaxID=196858 RepID=UPI0011BD4EA7|nr:MULTISPECIES: DUF2254 domain-containing protein [unclassified Polaribacter]TXD51180.1 DUF2254 domain-containing protein [Polaribacter sp. IC063]TXD59085.1 DUF2254 domain-containing protein [Polaribacter sp. IC066]